MKTSRLVLAIAIGVPLLGLAAFAANKSYCERAERTALRQKIDSIMHEGSKLSAMTSQGVTFKDFNSQLAAVHAEYDRLTTWPAAYDNLLAALKNWDLALFFWRKDLNLNESFRHISSDPDLLSFYTSHDPTLRALAVEPGRLQVADVSAQSTRYERSEDRPGVNLDIAVRVFMDDARDRFSGFKPENP